MRSSTRPTPHCWAAGSSTAPSTGRQGPELLTECRTLGGCETGQAKITKAYRLPARYVIHTPGPIWRSGSAGEEALLESCYRSCLRLAEEYGCKTVAFPSVSTGVYQFPLDRAAEIAVRTILDFLRHAETVESVMMVCFDPETKSAYDRALTRMETGEARS